MQRTTVIRAENDGLLVVATSEWLDLLELAGVPAAPVYDIAEMAAE